MPEVAIAVEVLHVRIDDIRRLDGITGLECAFDDAAGLEVADLDSIEGLALAGLDHLVFDDGVRIVVQQDFQTRLELIGGVAGHGAL